MLAALRAGLLAVPLFLAAISTAFADKAFQRDDLADGAIKLAAQVKAEAARASRPAAAVRRDADAALGRRDYRNAAELLGWVAASAPDDSTNWLRFARATLQISPSDDDEKTALLERASTAAYIAYQRAKSRDEEAASLTLLSRTFAERKLWRPALEFAAALTRSARCRGRTRHL